jgi:membrane associated rhomboid family serine protease
VTLSIIAICTAAHALLAWRSDYPEIVRELGVIGGSVRAYALMTHMFLHGSVLHLATNMVVLLAVGSVLERRVGRIAFAAVYLLGGLAGAGASILIDPRIFAAGIGASGAVFAVMALCIVVAPWARLKIWLHFLVAAGRIDVPAAWAFAVGAVMQAFGAVRLAVGSAGGVGYWSHIGGLVLGLAAGVLLRVTRLVRPEAQATADGAAPAQVPAEPAAGDREGPEPTPTAEAAARLGRVRPRRQSRDIVLPYALVGISLAISIAAAVATLTSGSLLGVLAGFQRAWNSGELPRVERYFKESSREALSDQFRQLMRRVEGDSAEAGRTELRISLSDAYPRGKGYAARFLCAPPGKDPHRSKPGEVGTLEIWLSKEAGSWRVSGMTLRNVGD